MGVVSATPKGHGSGSATPLAKMRAVSHPRVAQIKGWLRIYFLFYFFKVLKIKNIYIVAMSALTWL
jgi:hypothetical protein